MPASRLSAQLLDYCILPNTEFQGPVIGRLDGRDFSEFVRDEFGRLFVYSGVAPRRGDGQFDQDALKTGEFIVPPGLIYRYRGKARRRAA